MSFVEKMCTTTCGTCIYFLFRLMIFVAGGWLGWYLMSKITDPQMKIQTVLIILAMWAFSLDKKVTNK